MQPIKNTDSQLLRLGFLAITLSSKSWFLSLVLQRPRMSRSRLGSTFFFARGNLKENISRSWHSGAKRLSALDFPEIKVKKEILTLLQRKMEHKAKTISNRGRQKYVCKYPKTKLIVTGYCCGIIDTRKLSMSRARISIFYYKKIFKPTWNQHCIII